MRRIRPRWTIASALASGGRASLRRLVLACAFASCVATLPASCASPHNPATRAAIRDIISDNATAHAIPAQAVVVLHNHAVVHRQFTGTTAIDASSDVDGNTVFPVFSVGKLFAATLLLQLADQGKVDLAAPASRYVADLPQAWHAIPVGQFLDHVSGIPEYFDPDNPARPFPPSLPAVFAALGNLPLAEPPDTRTRYTNTDFLVIAAVLESVTGRRYGDLVRGRILVPLHLRSTWLGRDGVPRERLVADYHAEHGQLVADTPIAWPGYSTAHGNLYSTANDMATFLTAVADGKFIARASLLRLWRPHAFANGNRGYFASGWEYGESGAWHEVGHDGGTKVRVRILFRKDLAEHYVIVYLTNGSRDDVWSRTLVDAVQTLVLPR